MVFPSDAKFTLRSFRAFVTTQPIMIISAVGKMMLEGTDWSFMDFFPATTAAVIDKPITTNYHSIYSDICRENIRVVKIKRS